jgi:hypothetical protein
MDIIFVIKYFSGDLFRAALYKLMLVLHKDVLFSCSNISKFPFFRLSPTIPTSCLVGWASSRCPWAWS